jgi:hypothetical protein
MITLSRFRISLHRFHCPLRLRHLHERLPGHDLVGKDLDQLLPVHADPSPVAYQAHGPEQIPFDHEAVEAPDALLRVDPVQDQVVLDRGAEFIGHLPYSAS